MLDKNEIINGLKNRDYLVRNAIYENIVNLCLYDDKEIQDAVRFMRKNGCMLHFKSFSLRRRVILILCCSASWWSITATGFLIKISLLLKR